MVFEVDYNGTRKEVEAGIRHERSIFAVEVVATQMYDGRRSRKFDWNYLGEKPNYDAGIALLKEAIEMLEWRKVNASKKAAREVEP